jgi:hypothetical protein
VSDPTISQVRASDGEVYRTLDDAAFDALRLRLHSSMTEIAFAEQFFSEGEVPDGNGCLTAVILNLTAIQEDMQALQVKPQSSIAVAAESEIKKMLVDPANPWKVTWCDGITSDSESRLMQIKNSTDVEWLKRVIAYPNNQKSVQQAAERRLRKLTKGGA